MAEKQINARILPPPVDQRARLEAAKAAIATWLAAEVEAIAPRVLPQEPPKKPPSGRYVIQYRELPPGEWELASRSPVSHEEAVAALGTVVGREWRAVDPWTGNVLQPVPESVSFSLSERLALIARVRETLPPEAPRGEQIHVVVLDQGPDGPVPGARTFPDLGAAAAWLQSPLGRRAWPDITIVRGGDVVSLHEVEPTVMGWTDEENANPAERNPR